MITAPDGTRISADSDPYFRGKPVNVRDEDGVFCCDIEPWRSVDEFEQACDLLGAFPQKELSNGVWTTQAYLDMLAWGEAQEKHRAIARDLLDSSKRRALGLVV